MSHIGKKILFINHDNNEKGGASKSLFNLVNELKRRGYEPTVIVNGNGNLDRLFREKGIETINIKFLWWQIPKKFGVIKRNLYKILRVLNIFATIKIIKICNKNKIDIIHSNSSVIDIGMNVANYINIKHFWHFREFGLLDLNLEYLYGRKKSISKINNSSSKVIMISKSLMEHYSDIERSYLCYNGVEENNIFKKKHEGNIFNILMSGRISEGKGQLIVLKALKRLLDLGINNFKLYLYGFAIEPEYFNRVEKMIKENNMQKHVYIKGYTENISEIRKSMDIEVVASKSEAFGRVIVEAMKSSCVVIGANCGACSELINNYEDGLLFEYNDQDDLVEKISSLLTKRIDINYISENAYKNMRNKFTVQTNCDEFLNIIDNKKII